MPTIEPKAVHALPVVHEPHAAAFEWDVRDVDARRDMQHRGRTAGRRGGRRLTHDAAWIPYQ